VTVRLRRTTVDGVYGIVLAGCPTTKFDRKSGFEPCRAEWRRKRLDGTEVRSFPTLRAGVVAYGRHEHPRRP
jgi:hypothetical protein